MRMRKTETTTTATAPTSNADGRSADRNRPAGVLPPEARRAPSSWPFNQDDVTPLEWWRTMPADHLGDAQLSHLRATVAKISVMKDRQWLSALQGNAAASIAIAIGAMPIGQITLEIDLAMSSLTLCALDGSAGAALVLSHILRHTPLDHPFGSELSVSWLMLNLDCAFTEKRYRTKPRLPKPSDAPHGRQTSPCSPVPA
jgi:hypothetical protein